MNRIDCYSIKKFDLVTDRQDLLSLWQRNLPSVSTERFSWLYDRDDSYAMSTWILLYKGIVCGSISVLFRKMIEFQGGNVSFGFFCDFMVDEKHRTLLPALQLLKFAISECSSKKVDFLLALPNKNAAPVFNRAGFGQPFTLNRWVNLIDCHEKINFPEIIIGRFLKRKISWMVNSFKKYAIDLYFLRHQRYISHWKDDFSSMWSSNEDDSNQSVSNLRNFVFWRYRDNPINDYFLFSVRYKRSPVNIIYFIQKEEAIISKIIFQENKAVGIALQQFTNYLRYKGIKSVSLLLKGTRNLEIELRKSGFVKRPTTARLMILNFKKRGKELFDYLNLFEGDMDL